VYFFLLDRNMFDVVTSEKKSGIYRLEQFIQKCGAENCSV